MLRLAPASLPPPACHHHLANPHIHICITHVRNYIALAASGPAKDCALTCFALLEAHRGHLPALFSPHPPYFCPLATEPRERRASEHDGGGLSTIRPHVWPSQAVMGPYTVLSALPEPSHTQHHSSPPLDILASITKSNVSPCARCVRVPGTYRSPTPLYTAAFAHPPHPAASMRCAIFALTLASFVSLFSTGLRVSERRRPAGATLRKPKPRDVRRAKISKGFGNA